jgi:hypothetical protein
MTFEANFMYVPSDKMGYGRMGVRLHEALTAKGMKLRAHPDVDGPCNVACWASIPSHAQGWFEGQYTTCLTMWEATRLPEAFREQMHEFDQIIVPSAQNVELFSRYHPNVKQIRLGFDSDWWQYVKRTPPTNEFVFLIGGSGARKGIDLVASAYRHLWGKPGSWGDGPTPVVWFKSPTGVVQDAEGVECPRILDRMKIIGGRLSNEEERDLYAMAHCYVQPSRGEGFGLQPLQAIAQGLPTILTDAHGHASYAHLGMGLSSTLVPTAPFIHGDAGEWWEPDFAELCDWMVYVYENYAEACDRARFASSQAHRTFTWEQSAQDWIDCHDGLLGAYAGNGKWYTPEQKLFMLKTKVLWEPNIGSYAYRFEAGEEYWVPGDVKRMAFERGDMLHPDALLSEEGLTDAQVVKARKRKGSDAYCPSCQQRLNSGKTRSDDIFAELQAKENPLGAVTAKSIIDGVVRLGAKNPLP